MRHKELNVLCTLDTGDNVYGCYSKHR